MRTRSRRLTPCADFSKGADLTDKEFLKRVAKYVLTSALAIAAAVYMVYHIVSMFKTDMKVEPVQAAEISNQLTLTGVVFRDETVVYGQSGGAVRMFPNGEKVRKNAVVVRVYDTIRSDDRALSAIEKKIDILTDSNRVSDTGTKNTDAKISKLYYTLRLKAEEGDYATLTEKADELLVLLNRREIITNERLNFNTEIADLQAQREKLISSSEGDAYEVRSPAAGYFSSYVDGYEGVFTSAAAKELGYEELSALLDSRPEKTNVTEEGYAVGKIAPSAVWYICADTDRDTARKLTEGATYRISFPMAGSETDFTLLRIVTENKGEGAVLVFSTDYLSRDIGSVRKQTVSVIREKTVGLRVPVSAVRMNEDGEVGVFILKNDKVTFRKIEIIAEQDGYCIAREYSPDEEGYADMLHKYDNLIVSGKGLKEQTEPDGETEEYEIRIFG